MTTSAMFRIYLVFKLLAFRFLSSFVLHDIVLDLAEILQDNVLDVGGRARWT